MLDGIMEMYSTPRPYWQAVVALAMSISTMVALLAVEAILGGARASISPIAYLAGLLSLFCVFFCSIRLFRPDMRLTFREAALLVIGLAFSVALVHLVLA